MHSRRRYAIHDFLEAPFQLDLPSKKIKINEVKMILKNNLNLKKAPGYDLITVKVLKELSEKGMKVLTIICNVILRTGIFPDQWEVAQIILIPKPGKKTRKKLRHIDPSVCYQACRSYLKKYCSRN
jgi:hypothetical protein